MSTEAEERASGRRALGRKAGWNLADQAVSSLGTAVVAFLIARAVSAEEFGVFGICFATLTFLVGVHRALGSQAYAIRYPLAKGQADPRLAGLCLGVAVTTALAATPLIVAGAFLLGRWEWVLAVLIFAGVQPFLLMQDAVRSTLLAQGRPRDATVNDVVTTAVQAAGAATGAAMGADIGAMVALWACGAVVGSLLGWIQLQSAPRVRGLPAWLRDVGHVSWPLLGEWVVLAGAAQIVFLGIGALAGVAALGSIRAAQTLLGPLSAFGLAITAFALPHLSAQHLTARQVRSYAWVLSLILLAVDLGWGLVLVLLPDTVGTELLGASWGGSQIVLVPLLLQQVAIGMGGGPIVLLATMRQTNRSFRVAVLHAALLSVLGLSGAFLFDARAATTGLALASALVIPVAFWQLRSGIRQRPASTDHTSPQATVE